MPLHAPSVQTLLVPQLVPLVGVISAPPLHTVLVPTLVVAVWHAALPPTQKSVLDFDLTQVELQPFHPLSVQSVSGSVPALA